MLGAEPAEHGILKMEQARARIEQLIRQYSLAVDLAAKVESITVGMQQRVEILKMLYRDNDILIFDEPTAVLIPQEIEELMKIIRGLTKEGKSVLFISHKLRLTRKYLLERRAGIPPKCPFQQKLLQSLSRIPRRAVHSMAKGGTMAAPIRNGA